MNKNVIYIGIAAIIGLLLGYLIFGNTTPNVSIEDHDHSAKASDQIWTCSMHPQIMQPESGSCPICGMDLIFASTKNKGLAKHQFKMTENAMALANVQTSIIGNDVITDGEFKLSGKIEENEETNTVQVSHFGGRIEKLFVRSVGEKVRQGQVLAMIYSPKLVAAQQELLTSVSLKKTQPELYKAVRNKLRIKKITETQIDQIETSGKIKEVFPVHAHFSGIVSEKLVEEGNHVNVGQMLYKITNLTTVWASFDAYENQISTLKVGQKLKIKSNAYPDKRFDAKISFIDPVLNTATRTVKVRATLSNKQGVFKPGMFVEALIEGMVTKPENTIVVPKSAVLWTGKRSIVYVKSESDQPVFEMREITLGAVKGDKYVISDGLVNGEEVVTNGTFTLDAAAQLQGKKSMMYKDDNTTNKGQKEYLSMGEDEVNSDKKAEDVKMQLSESFQMSFVSTLQSYFLMKDALVESDPSVVAVFAQQAMKEMGAISVSELGKIEYTHFKNSIERLEAISKKEDIIDQRAHFVILNQHLIALIKKVKMLPNIVYIQECPMANNNKGAVWLSQEAAIRNPYYGDQMLTCGSVVDTLSVKKNKG